MAEQGPSASKPKKARTGGLNRPGSDGGSGRFKSTFATVRQRTKVTKGPGSRAAGLAMAYKLIGTAQARWRKINSPHLATLVRAGARFEKGQLVTPTHEDQVAA